MIFLRLKVVKTNPKPFFSFWEGKVWNIYQKNSHLEYISTKKRWTLTSLKRSKIHLKILYECPFISSNQFIVDNLPPSDVNIMTTSWMSVCSVNWEKARTNGPIDRSTWTYGTFEIRMKWVKFGNARSKVTSIINETPDDKCEHAKNTTISKMVCKINF